jgi:hypothetical protein
MQGKNRARHWLCRAHSSTTSTEAGGQETERIIIHGRQKWRIAAASMDSTCRTRRSMQPWHHRPARAMISNHESVGSLQPGGEALQLNRKPWPQRQWRSTKMFPLAMAIGCRVCIVEHDIVSARQPHGTHAPICSVPLWNRVMGGKGSTKNGVQKNLRTPMTCVVMMFQATQEVI